MKAYEERESKNDKLYFLIESKHGGGHTERFAFMISNCIRFVGVVGLAEERLFRQRLLNQRPPF